MVEPDLGGYLHVLVMYRPVEEMRKCWNDSLWIWLQPNAHFYISVVVHCIILFSESIHFQRIGHEWRGYNVKAMTELSPYREPRLYHWIYR